ncbi:glycoside hydrolase family 3 N-terminal domain-containing protein [Virgibacillus byunsanensis]|uniref:Glycoside hydrolase family 3 N-terminal domain-containing protein n=1 Tax=Virgibacillus byunsanensis TaxID=570945 RepID=A0ABW3LL55_9BACI
MPQIDSEFPASMSGKIIHDLLREKLGYSGVVITDDMTMKAITDNFDIGEASVKSVHAGSDIIMVAHDFQKIMYVFETLKEAVENGEITEERINESVNRILRLKSEYNIADLD